MEQRLAYENLRKNDPDECARQERAAIEAFIRIAEGTSWKEAGIPGLPMRVSQDIRGYYETAALAMVDHAPPAWAGARWFFDATQAGKVLIDLKKGG